MELKIEDVKIGTRLELVEEELRKATKPFVLGWLDYMRSQEEIIVTGLEDDMLEVNHNEDWGISEDSIGYFKKKEKPQQYTFDDLIDAAVKAKKDGVLSELIINDENIEYVLNGNDRSSGGYGVFAVKEGIEYLQSLYKETFVIECEDDIDRIKKGAKITLLNGNKSKVKRVDDDSTLEVEGWDYFLQFFSLKGATVTQSK